MKASTPKLGEIVDGKKVIRIENITKGLTTVTVMPLSSYPKFNFSIHIKCSYETGEFYAVGKAKNNETIFTWELRKSKSGLIKTIYNLFGEGIKVVDTTKEIHPLINLNNKEEVTGIISDMKKEGINIDKGNIKAAVTQVGRSRKLVYRLLRDLYGREEA